MIAYKYDYISMIAYKYAYISMIAYKMMDRHEIMLRQNFCLAASKDRAYIDCLPHTYILK